MGGLGEAVDHGQHINYCEDRHCVGISVTGVIGKPAPDCSQDATEGAGDEILEVASNSWSDVRIHLLRNKFVCLPRMHHDPDLG